MRRAAHGQIIADYRGWLDQLTPEVGGKIAHGNARALIAAR